MRNNLRPLAVLVLSFSLPALACAYLSPGTGISIASIDTATSTGTASVPATVMPTASGSAISPGTLAVSSVYPLRVAQGFAGLSLTTSPGKVWLGTGMGTIEEVDAQTGALIQSIPLITGEGPRYFVHTLGFDGRYIAALEQIPKQGYPHPYVFAVDSRSGTVVHQWDLDSPEWSKTSRMGSSVHLGVSPGKIWVDGHVIDTQTFDVTEVSMPPMARYAYNGNGWLWITGDTGGSCDDLVFVETDDPSNVVCQPRLPFFAEPNDVYPDVSIMALAGDRVWMVTSGAGGGQNLTITAYPADMDQLMKATKPSAIVTLMDSSHQIGMLYAGKYLWLLWKSGEKRGFLYQLEPQTGATVNSLDLVGDEGRAKGDIPLDMAAEGDNLWIVTMFQLLRIGLP
jgi:hypothetical protein